MPSLLIAPVGRRVGHSRCHIRQIKAVPQGTGADRSRPWHPQIRKKPVVRASTESQLDQVLPLRSVAATVLGGGPGLSHLTSFLRGPVGMIRRRPPLSQDHRSGTRDGIPTRPPSLGSGGRPFQGRWSKWLCLALKKRKVAWREI